MLGGVQLESGLSEKPLKVPVGTNLNSNQPSALAAKYVNGTLDCIRQSIAKRSREKILPLYSAMVRPHLESCIQFWDSQYERDMNVLERVR